MPRTARASAAGYVYHVINHGNARACGETIEGFGPATIGDSQRRRRGPGDVDEDRPRAGRQFDASQHSRLGLRGMMRPDVFETRAVGDDPFKGNVQARCPLPDIEEHEDRLVAELARVDEDVPFGVEDPE